MGFKGNGGRCAHRSKAKVVTAGGDSVFVTKNAMGVFVNGINVVTADKPASNGVIHTISKSIASS